MIQYIVLLGGVVSLLGVFDYLKETLRGNTKPNRVSWLMWTIAPLIATFAAFSDGVRWAVVPIFMTGLGNLLVFIASFVNKNAYWKLTRLDYLCGFFSMFALILWAITKESAIAIIFTIASDGFASIPTIVKGWRYSETETGLAYVAGLFGALTSFVAIKIWNFSSYGFASYVVIANTFIIFSIYHKKLLRFGRR